MARPKIFDFDPASEETVVTQGAECAELQWFGINPENGLVHIVCNVGTLNATGDGVEDITYRAIQITLEGQDALDFYTANKTAIDAIHSAALEKWALDKGKTGEVIES